MGQSFSEFLKRHRPTLTRMEVAEIVLVVAVLAGMCVQATIGFGFAFFAAPAAFAALPPERAVTLLVLLSIPIGLLVLFGERRTASYARRAVAFLVVGAMPGMLIGSGSSARSTTRRSRSPWASSCSPGRACRCAPRR